LFWIPFGTLQIGENSKYLEKNNNNAVGRGNFCRLQITWPFYPHSVGACRHA
jgi:hypothetical protein